MNPLTRTSLVHLLLLFSLSVSVSGQSASDPLSDLPENKREQVRELIQTASENLSGVRMLQALQALDKAEAIAPEFHVIHNLRGAVYTKLKDFDKARSHFERALSLKPDAFEARFNYFEIFFVQGEYRRALSGFNELINNFPRMPESIRDMARYKILLCHLALDQPDQAKAMARRFSYLDDTPVYYFAKAANELFEGNRGEATGWIASANRIYGAQTGQLYVDSLQEMGLLPSLTAAGLADLEVPDGGATSGE